MLLYSNHCPHIAPVWLVGPYSHRRCSLAIESWQTSLAPSLRAWEGMCDVVRSCMQPCCASYYSSQSFLGVTNSSCPRIVLYRCVLFPKPCSGTDVSRYYVVTPLVPSKLGDENRRAGLGVRGRSVGVGSGRGVVRTSLRVVSMRKSALTWRRSPLLCCPFVCPLVKHPANRHRVQQLFSSVPGFSSSFTYCFVFLATHRW